MRKRLNIIIGLLVIIIMLMVASMLTSCDGYKGLHRENYGRSQQNKALTQQEIQQHYIK